MRKALVKIESMICVLAVTGCAMGSTSIDDVFLNPEDYVGNEIEVCGWLEYGFENHNLYPNKKSARTDMLGIGVVPGDVGYDALRASSSRNACLSGEVRYSGCAVTVICSASGFEYEMIVHKMTRKEDR